MTDDRRLLIECYRSGQISAAAWQEHLAADPELRAMVDRPVDGGTRRPRLYGGEVMTDIVERLRSTTEQMASNCSVDMTLWCEHSGAALEAAAEIELLRLSLSETEDNTLLSYLADIRQKSGVGIKPMLSELADAIATALSEARATGRREGLSEALKLADALRDEQRKFQTHASANGFKSEARDHESMKFAAVHLSSAIRAAMEK